jgi:CRISPR-associated endonuclease Csn1
MFYRLALDLGSTSLGWALIRLNDKNEPIAIIKAGSRIFSDGRNPKDGTSLAVTRRDARAMRRRRDRLLKRKARMMRALIEHGFFPTDEAERKSLERLDPYALRAKGLDEPLTPTEFARALFHINQRRGFKSNRKTDAKESDSSVMKGAINSLRSLLASGAARTVGEWLHLRTQNGDTTRARRRENTVVREDGKNKKVVSYDLYIDRAMVEQEFDALWKKQASLNPSVYTEAIGAEFKDVLLHQRPLKPVRPGRCTFIPTEERAPLALPSVQRFRIYQETNNLRILGRGLDAVALTKEQRDIVAEALEHNGKQTFTQLKKLLALGGSTTFTHEDVKRTELKGNSTHSILSKAENFGNEWFDFDTSTQDEIVAHILTEESEVALVNWLTAYSSVDEQRAERIAQVGLAEGYGSVSRAALARILPELVRDVVTFDKAVIAAGFEHHSNLSPAATGEILAEMPYYGEPLQRYVGFADPRATESDPPEKRFGRIANPTVHIGLNQVRKVVNALIHKYGHPAEVIVEVARDLKQNKEQRDEESKRQRANQDRNDRYRTLVADQLRIGENQVRRDDLQKVLLWEELSLGDALNRKCPYSGESISLGMLLSDQVEIEHILPFSMTLDDSLNNKNATPWQAFGDRTIAGYDFNAILARAELMPKNKRYRFGKDGYQQWLREDKDFLARALNDTRYLSRVAREYVRLICPGARVIPGQMTAMLRGKFGVNNVLGVSGEKNRNDHRHHAVDACVIGVTDQGMLQKFASASASARERGLGRLVEMMPDPWPTYRTHVERAVNAIWVSHKPDHSHEGAMHNDTAYGLLRDGFVRHYKTTDGKRERMQEALKVVPMSSYRAGGRHGFKDDGSPRPYKGYKGDSNYCIDIVRNEKGKWEGEVVSTFNAYQIVRTEGVSRLRDSKLSVSGKPLVMRLIVNDSVRLNVNGILRTMRVAKISGNGQIFMADCNEANVDSRNRDKGDVFFYVSKMAGSLLSAQGRRVTISEIGEVRDPGFKG